MYFIYNFVLIKLKDIHVCMHTPTIYKYYILYETIYWLVYESLLLLDMLSLLKIVMDKVSTKGVRCLDKGIEYIKNNLEMSSSFYRSCWLYVALNRYGTVSDFLYSNWHVSWYGIVIIQELSLNTCTYEQFFFHMVHR